MSQHQQMAVLPLTTPLLWLLLFLLLVLLLLVLLLGKTVLLAAV
jgi:hypothetical protein